MKSVAVLLSTALAASLMSRREVLADVLAALVHAMDEQRPTLLVVDLLRHAVLRSRKPERAVCQRADGNGGES